MSNTRDAAKKKTKANAAENKRKRNWDAEKKKRKRDETGRAKAAKKKKEEANFKRTGTIHGVDINSPKHPNANRPKPPRRKGMQIPSSGSKRESSGW